MTYRDLHYICDTIDRKHLDNDVLIYIGKIPYYLVGLVGGSLKAIPIICDTCKYCGKDIPHTCDVCTISNYNIGMWEERK